MDEEVIETSNDESTTISDEQLNEWAGLSAEEINEDQGEDQSELSAEEIIEEESKGLNESESETKEEQPTKDLDLVSELNSLRLIHNEIPFEVKSAAHAVELIQKGYDYTQKMQGFSQEKNAAYEEYNQKVEQLEASYKENSELLNKAQIFDYALKNMAETNPGLHDEVLAFVNGSTQAFNNPVISSLQNELKLLKEQIGQYTTVSQNKEIVGGLERDMDVFKKEITPVAKNLGLVPQWEKVKELWARDSEGKMSIKQAFYAVHGEDIQKLRASKQNVSQTARKTTVAKKSPSSSTLKGSRGGGTSEDYSGMSLEQAAMKIAFG